MALDGGGDGADILRLIAVRGILSSLTLMSKQARLPILTQRPIQMRAPTRRAIMAAIGMLLAG